MPFEGKEVHFVVVVDLGAVAEELLKRHRVTGHGLQQVEVGGGG